MSATRPVPIPSNEYEAGGQKTPAVAAGRNLSAQWRPNNVQPSSFPPQIQQENSLSETEAATSSITAESNTSDQSNQQRNEPVLLENGAKNENPWDRKSLLTLDGGGVRGYSSLLILQHLMKTISSIEQENPNVQSSVHPLECRDYEFRRAIERRATRLEEEESPPEEAFEHMSESSRYLPCHYFDYIAGTSTGGLIAIMLGRLSMTVDEALKAYETLADRVIAIAWRSFDMGGTRVPYLFRSYRHPKSVKENLLERNPGQANDYPIWKIGRATSAAPTYFSAVKLEDDNDDTYFIDGGFGANNPSEEAYRSVKQLSSNNPGVVECLVSIGTGKNIQATSPRNTGWRLYLKIANAAVKWAAQSEATHENMIDRTKDVTDYFRLNVEHGIGRMKLDAWKGVRGTKTLTAIREATEDYLKNSAVESEILRIARILVAKRNLRSSPTHIDQWERFCHGVEYLCCVDRCHNAGNVYSSRRELQYHIETSHNTEIQRDDIQTVLDQGKRYPLYDIVT
ncbi:MAG: hypothetical protein Q9167_001813 [Letrouitia subvulpina]